MRLAWHIVKKDFRLERAIVIAWILLVLINLVDRLAVPALAGNTQWQNYFGTWSLMVGLSTLLVLLLCIANVIQADRLVGSTAFWLTRPIPRGTLLASKLFGLSLFIILPSLLVEAILMAAFHVSAATLAAALLQQGVTMVIIVGVVLFAATLTMTSVRLLLTFIGAIFASPIVFRVVAMLATPPRPSARSSSPSAC
jgi:ABC-type transport system involved in multi-copper enzyme maturation permease subunit